MANGTTGVEARGWRGRIERWLRGLFGRAQPKVDQAPPVTKSVPPIADREAGAPVFPTAPIGSSASTAPTEPARADARGSERARTPEDAKEAEFLSKLERRAMDVFAASVATGTDRSAASSEPDDVPPREPGLPQFTHRAIEEPRTEQVAGSPERQSEQIPGDGGVSAAQAEAHASALAAEREERPVGAAEVRDERVSEPSHQENEGTTATSPKPRRTQRGRGRKRAAPDAARSSEEAVTTKESPMTRVDDAGSPRILPAAGARSLPRVGGESATSTLSEGALGKVIAIANQKGGVGKTTCAINLGGALVELGRRVLCVDLDPQANLTVGLGVDLNKVERSIAEVLIDPSVSLASVILSTKTNNLDVAPATIDLSAAEVELFTAIGREMAFRDKLDPQVISHYDYVLVDCPPTLGLLTVNGLVAAHGVIVPVQTQYYALKGVAALLKMIRTVQSKLNPNLSVVGILPTFYDSRTILSREMLDSLKDLGDHNVFHTVIRQWIKLGEAPTAGIPITRYDARSEAAKSFLELAREVVSHA